MSDEGGRGAILFAARIRVERLVIPLAHLGGGAGCPIESRIKNVAAAFRVPSQPGVSLAAARRPLADHEADVRRAVLAHFLIKGDRFRFAIGRGAGLGFSGSFPEGGEAVGDRAQIRHPLVNNRDRDLGARSMRRSGQYGADSSHLAVIGGGAHCKQEGVGEGRGSGQAEEERGEEKGLFHGWWFLIGFILTIISISNGRAIT